MIDFRYHVVSIVAVLLALALGLFLGSTTLQGAVFNDLDKRTKGVASENHRLQQQAAELHAEVNNGHAFADAVEPYAVAGRLSGQSVVIISAPGADGGTRKRLEQTLTDAGATVTGDIRLRETFLDPRQDALLGSLAQRLAGPARLPQGTGVAQAAAQLAGVLVTKPGSRPPSPSLLAQSLAAYSDGSLLEVASASVHAGTVAVVLAGSPPPVASAGAVNGDLMVLAQALARAAGAAALAGPTSAATAPGVLAAARGNSAFTAQVSTVDGLETGQGAIATAFALAAQLNGRIGSYGTAAGASAVLPAPSAAP